jgi:uncharacterized protein (TIGR03437 family)
MKSAGSFSLTVLLVAAACAQPASAASQTITFDAIPNQILGISPFPIAAQSNSLLPVGFISTTPTVCKLAGDLVTVVGTGTCSITASQPGNASFSAAASVTRSFIVSAAKPSGSFMEAAGSPLTAGTGSTFAAVGDFNKDGIPDLAVANFFSGNVTVLLGNGSGEFTAAPGSPFAAGVQPHGIAVGDFNGDGKQDLAVANAGSNNVTVLLGNDMGGFTPAIGSPFTVGTFPLSVAVGDFNGDGIQDLAIANSTSANVVVLLGNGSASFTAAPGSPFTAGRGAGSVAVGDFNGDGIEDLATANQVDSNVTVLLGNGSGGFSPAQGSPFGAGGSPSSVMVGDFNGDGLKDLAVANFNTNNITVLLGNGAGGFNAAPASPFTVGTNPYSVVVADYNGDGIEDLATANYGSNDVTVLLGDGSGGFRLAQGSPFAAGANPPSVAVGDFNGDDIEDLATANKGSNNVTVLLGFVTGHTAQTIAFGPPINSTLITEAVALSATASSGLAVTFNSNSALVCTVSGSNATLVGAGTCSITASQIGNSTWAPATPVVRTFTVSSVGPPGIVSLSPNAGTGNPVTFKAVYSDPNGARDLNEVLLQVNTTQTSAHACYVYYHPQGNQLYLFNDAGNAFTIPALTPGVAGTASNSQCTLDAGSSSVTTSGNTLTLNVALTFSSKFIGAQNVYLHAAGFSGQNSGWIKEGMWTAVPCVPAKLVLTLSSITAGASLASGVPFPLGVTVSDNCGNPTSSAQVVATFSNGDPAVSLTSVSTSSGSYAGTWVPGNVQSQTQVAVTFLASTTGLAAGQTSIIVTLTGLAPSIIGIADSASFQSGSLSPGSFISIFGRNLAASIASAAVLPLPATLAGTSVTAGGIQAPMFYASPTQINAILPYSLTPNSQYQVIVNSNGALSAPASIQIAAANPGIFTYGQNIGIAQDLKGNLISSANPALLGEIIVIYCSGLGATNPSIVAGTTSPSAPPAASSTTPTVTIGGVPANVIFAGLTPTLAGLYQIDVQVPLESPVGAQVQLLIAVGDISGVAVNLPVQ